MKIEDLDTLPTIGEYYSVPCIYSNLAKGQSAWVPILCRHIGDISGVDHYHADVRFMSTRRLKELDVPVDAVFGGMAEGRFITIRRLKKKCFRQFPPIQKTIHENGVDAFELLQDMMRNTQKTCAVCPHQGVNLKQVPVIEYKGQKVQVCPAHGLMWGKDGELVRRTIYMV